VSAAPPEPEPNLQTIFDCDGLGAKPPATCGELPEAAREIIEAAHWFEASALRCGLGLTGPRLERATKALNRASTIKESELAPLARALLQNAALRLLSCSVGAQPPKEGERVAKSARALVRRLAFSDRDLAALPTAESQLGPWLEQTASWVPATQRQTRIHDISSGYTLAQQPLKRDNDVANVARLIVVDTRGAPRVTDTVSRLQMRRTGASQVRVCIAEIDPGESCKAALRPIEPDIGKTLVGGGRGGASCGTCHIGGRRPRSQFATATAQVAQPGPSDDFSSIAVRELGPLLVEKAP